MAVKVLITEQARDMLEKEQTRRIRENWKRGYSLEQIASEAIIWFLTVGHAQDAFKDDNSPVSKEGF